VWLNGFDIFSWESNSVLNYFKRKIGNIYYLYNYIRERYVRRITDFPKTERR